MMLLLGCRGVIYKKVVKSTAASSRIGTEMGDNNVLLP